MRRRTPELATDDSSTSSPISSSLNEEISGEANSWFLGSPVACSMARIFSSLTLPGASEGVTDAAIASRRLILTHGR